MMTATTIQLYLAAVITTTLLITASNAQFVDFGFTIDSTGSMHDEIVSVRNGVRQILKYRPPGITNFTVVTFKDPNVEHAITSNDSDTINSFMGTVTPKGGGDCPEMAMAGLLKTISLVQPNSFIFFFSDASAKDYSRVGEVTTAAKNKGVTIYLVMTGCCSNCKDTGYVKYQTIEIYVNAKIYKVEKTQVTQFMDFVFVTATNNIAQLRKPPLSFSEVISTAAKLPSVLKSLGSTTTAATENSSSMMKGQLFLLFASLAAALLRTQQYA